MQWLDGEPLAFVTIQTNHNGVFVVWRNESNPAIRQSIFFTKQMVNPRVQSRHCMRAIPECLVAAYEFNDRIAIEAFFPRRAPTMQP